MEICVKLSNLPKNTNLKNAKFAQLDPSKSFVFVIFYDNSLVCFDSTLRRVKQIFNSTYRKCCWLNENIFDSQKLFCITVNGEIEIYKFHKNSCNVTCEIQINNDLIKYSFLEYNIEYHPDSLSLLYTIDQHYIIQHDSNIMKVHLFDKHKLLVSEFYKLDITPICLKYINNCLITIAVVNNLIQIYDFSKKRLAATIVGINISDNLNSFDHVEITSNFTFMILLKKYECYVIDLQQYFVENTKELFPIDVNDICLNENEISGKRHSTSSETSSVYEKDYTNKQRSFTRTTRCEFTWYDTVGLKPLHKYPLNDPLLYEKKTTKEFSAINRLSFLDGTLQILNFEIIDTNILVFYLKKENEKNNEYMIYEYNIIETKDKLFKIEFKPDIILLSKSLNFPHLLYGNDNGIFAVFFDLRQEELVNKLIVFSSASTADNLCNINNWDNCTIPIQSLENGIKHKQLDTISFFLRSKENMFAVYENSNNLLLINEDKATSGLQLLEIAVCDFLRNQQTENFGQELTTVVLQHLYKLTKNGNESIKKLKSINNDECILNIEKCLQSIMHYVLQFRKFQFRNKDFSESFTVKNLGNCPLSPKQITVMNEWTNLSEEQVILRGLKSEDVPFLQLYLTVKYQETNSFKRIANFGYKEAYNNLRQQRFDDACLLFYTLGFDWVKEIQQICMFTENKRLRGYLMNILTEKDLVDAEINDQINYIRKLEDIYPCSSFNNLQKHLHMNRQSFASIEFSNLSKYKSIANDIYINCSEIDQNEVSSSVGIGPYSNVLIQWTQHWNFQTRAFVLLDKILRQTDTIFEDCYKLTKMAWKYFILYSRSKEIKRWINAYFLKDLIAAKRWPFTEAIHENAFYELRFGTEAFQLDILHFLCKIGCIFKDFEPIENTLQRFSQCQTIISDLKLTDPHTNFTLINYEDFYYIFIQYCIDIDAKDVVYRFYDINNSKKLYKIMTSFNIPWINFLLRLFEIKSIDIKSIIIANHEFLLGERYNGNWQDILNYSIERAFSVLMFSDNYPKILSINFDIKEKDFETKLQWFNYFLIDDTKYKGINLNFKDLLKSNCEKYNFEGNRLEVCEDLSNGPHFSQETLVNLHGIECHLNFVYYLKQCRPSFAVYNLIQEYKIQNGTSLKRHLREALKLTYQFALENFIKLDIVTSCVVFLEILGLDSFPIRLNVQVANLIYDHEKSLLKCMEDRQTKLINLEYLIISKMKSCVLGEKYLMKEIVKKLETATLNILAKKRIEPGSSLAYKYWNLVTLFCRFYFIDISNTFFIEAAKSNNWLSFILYAQLYQQPAWMLKNHLRYFSNKYLGEHLHYAIISADLNQTDIDGSLNIKSFNKQNSKMRLKFDSENSDDEEIITEKKINSLKVERLFSEIESEDLLSLILACEKLGNTDKLLIESCLKYNNYILSIIAFCYQNCSLIDAMNAFLISQYDDDSLDDTKSVESMTTFDKFNKFSINAIKNGSLLIVLNCFKIFTPNLSIIHFLIFCHEFSLSLKSDTYLNSLKLFETAIIIPRTNIQTNYKEFSKDWSLGFIFQVMLALIDKFPIKMGVDFLICVKSISIQKWPNILHVIECMELCMDYKIVVVTSRLLENDLIEIKLTMERFISFKYFKEAKRFATLLSVPKNLICFKEIKYRKANSRKLQNWKKTKTIKMFWFWANDILKTNQCDSLAVVEFYKNNFQDIIIPEEEILLTSFILEWIKEANLGSEEFEKYLKHYWTCKLAYYETTGTICRVEKKSEEEQFIRKIVQLLDNDFNLFDMLDDNFENNLDEQKSKILSNMINDLIKESEILKAYQLCKTFGFLNEDLKIILNCMCLVQHLIKLSEMPMSLKKIIVSCKPLRKRYSTIASFSSSPRRSLISYDETDDDLSTDQISGTIQLFTSVIGYPANDYCERILVCYKISRIINFTYEQVIKEDPLTIMKLLLGNMSKMKYSLAQTFFKYSYLKWDKISDFLKDIIVTTYEKDIFIDNDEINQLVQICPSPLILGTDLVQFVDKFNLEFATKKELKLNVQLIIKAHDCHTLACNMEGICNVLRVTKKLTKVLTFHKEFNLLVELVLRIGRYNEMSDAIESLRINNQILTLLRLADRNDAYLRTTLLDFLKSNDTDDIFKMVMTNFNMHRELAENKVAYAKITLDNLLRKPLEKNNDDLLKTVIDSYQKAAAEYLRNDNVEQAERCIRKARLIALQLQLLNSKQFVLNLNHDELLNFVTTHKNYLHVYIVIEAYDSQRDYPYVIYQRAIVNNDLNFVQDFKSRNKFNDQLIKDVCEFCWKKESLPKQSLLTNLSKFLINYCKENAQVALQQAVKFDLRDVINELIGANRGLKDFC